jgi:hypothetical protein
VTPAEELRHIREGAAPGEASPGRLDTLEAPGDEATLARTREVLEAVVGRGSDGEWPGAGEWRTLLPAWFVDACVDDAEVGDCVLDRWSLRAWTYWFQPGLRHWRWWDARVQDGRVVVELLALQPAYLRGSLEWLLRVAR